MLCELYLNEATLKKKKKDKPANTVCSCQTSHYIWPRITHSNFIFLGCLIFKVCFSQGHRDREHFTPVREKLVESMADRGPQSSLLLSPEPQPRSDPLGPWLRHHTEASFWIQHPTRLRSSVRNALCGERCCHLKAHCESIYTSIKTVQFPAAYNVLHIKTGHIIKEVYGTWQIGILFQTLEIMVFKWLTQYLITWLSP